MHAAEWIVQHGNRLRTIGASKLRRELHRTKGECTWCGKTVPKPRRYWCSNDCTEAFLERQPARARNIVEMRDRGICARCQCDTIRLRSFLTKLWYGFDAGDPRERVQWRYVYQFYEAHLHGLGFNSGKGRLFHAPLWEADHVVPVVRGGGLCPPSGYRTLCVPCHAVVTAELNAELSREKRERKRSGSR